MPRDVREMLRAGAALPRHPVDVDRIVRRGRRLRRRRVAAWTAGLAALLATTVGLAVVALPRPPTGVDVVGEPATSPTPSLPGARRNPDGSITLPSHLAGYGPGAMWRARVVGDPTSGCVWFVNTGGRAAALWPPGYRAKFDPLRVIGPDGDVVAREGDELLMGGGWVQVMRDRIPPACRTDDLWWITSIDQRASVSPSQPKSPEIGELAAPRIGTDEIAAEDLPPLAAQPNVEIIDCDAMAARTSGPIISLPNPPARAGKAICYLYHINDPERPPELPPVEPVAHVLYVPNGVDPKKHSELSIIHAGGIALIAVLQDAETTVPEPTEDDPSHLAGGFAIVDVQGHRARVFRPSEHRVNLTWLIQEPDGRRYRVSISTGGYSPDEVVALGRSSERRPPRPEHRR